MKTTTKTIPVKAYISEYADPANLQDAHITLTQGDGRYWEENGYSFVGMGEAKLTIIIDPKELIGHKTAALKRQLQKVRADAELAERALLEKIGKLECLEWDGKDTNLACVADDAQC